MAYITVTATSFQKFTQSLYGSPILLKFEVNRCRVIRLINKKLGILTKCIVCIISCTDLSSDFHPTGYSNRIKCEVNHIVVVIIHKTARGKSGATIAGGAAIA